MRGSGGEKGNREGFKVRGRGSGVSREVVDVSRRGIEDRKVFCNSSVRCLEEEE